MKHYTTCMWRILVEDDNGRYFNILVEARDTSDATARVRYILDRDSARVVRVVRE